MSKVFTLGILNSALLIFSCTSPQTENKTPEQKSSVPKIPTPDFNADSAYIAIKTQIDFGPRIPGTISHAKCADYLISKLKTCGLDVQVQNGTVTTFDDKKFILKNIIASYKPEIANRILLTAHWDTRPWADLDSVEKDKPFDGADDGASGVAVLLEIARELKISKINAGVDIIFFDVEDYGVESTDPRYNQQQDTWCLGSQYWAKHPPKQGYFANYGILLDMVGGKNPVFPKEGTSMQFAPDVVNKVWGVAARIGYGNYFTDDVTGQTTDDHLYVNTLADIKCIDIVHYVMQDHNYPYFHHTHADNMNVIDKNTLKMVGQLLLEVIFSDNKGS